jgi:protein-tyrosine phosphatase
LRNLRVLELGQNNLTGLPSGLRKLTNVTTLNIHDNKLTKVPSSLSRLINLTDLDLSMNPVTSLPEFLPTLANLQKLNLSSLALKTFPEEVLSLVNLRSLNLERNYLSSISKKLTSLSALEKLDISYNDLSKPPSFLTSIETLKFVCLEGNKVDFNEKAVACPPGCRVRTQGAVPDQIIPGLWLGSLEAARNRHFLKRNGVTHVLSIIEFNCSFFPECFQYKHIEAKDLDEQDISPFLEEATAWIEEGIGAGGVVVHCAMGISRSASLVIAYIMKSQRIPFNEAHVFVKEKREIIFPNHGFREQLRNYEKTLEIPKESESSEKCNIC